MKKSTSLLIFICVLLSIQSIFAVCNLTNVTVNTNVERPAGSGIMGITIGNFTGTATYDIILTRSSTGEETIINGVSANPPVYNYFIPYTDLYNGDYTVKMRRHCSNGEESDWSEEYFLPIYSTLCKYDLPAACTGIALPATGTSPENIKEITIECSTFDGFLKPSIVANGGNITNYTVSSIPYAPPYPSSYGTQIFADAEDDIHDGITNLPFNFCFYGNTYDKAVVSSNGFIHFNFSYANQHAGYLFLGLADIPNPNFREDWRNAIYGVFNDIDPAFINKTGGSIRKAILGEFPCRVLSVTWYKIPRFACHGRDNDPDIIDTYQIILYEGSNIIEVYVKSRGDCSFNEGKGIIGVQNATGSLATVAPGRNLSNTWTAQNEGWRFTPVAEPNYTVTWYINGQSSWTGENLPLDFGELEGDTVVSRLNFTSCNGDIIDFSDTAIIHWDIQIENYKDSICQNTRYIKHGFNIDPQAKADTVIYCTKTAGYGGPCDAVSNLELKILPNKNSQYSQNICNGDVVDFFGQQLTESGRYQHHGETGSGCDSTIEINLSVSPKLQVSVAQIPDNICADDSYFKIPYSISEGEVSEFNVEFETKETVQGFISGQHLFEANEVTILIPQDVRPDHYNVKIVFMDTLYKCGDVTVDSIPFTINYKKSIIEQNWNDVIALLNKDHNGGFEFSHYQWYKNMEKIDGYTGSYIYLPEGLDTTAQYCLQIKRIDDGVTLFTCPITPVTKSETEKPQVEQNGNGTFKISAQKNGYVNIWSIYGHFIERKNLPSEINLSVSGVYLFEIVLENDTRVVEKVVVK
ncbi:MAG: hypothetical protein LBS50_06035 [Prevotellaceae bacterium]|jgi:hypothetical protein|nr:hypothetical protein [Prevotellaceae bacterium]